jgi:hypothetical protein
MNVVMDENAISGPPTDLFRHRIVANRGKIAVVRGILEETEVTGNKPALHGLSFAGKFRDSC